MSLKSNIIYGPKNLSVISEQCPEGQYWDRTSKECLYCPRDQWSSGGLATSCTPCPEGKGIDPGAGTSESSCYWSKLILNQVSCSTSRVELGVE